MPEPIMRSVVIAAPRGTNRVEKVLNSLVEPTVKVRDGQRWTAFSGCELDLSLAEPSELPAGASTSLNIKVDDVAATYKKLLEAGAESASEPSSGEHEFRASVWLAPSVALTVYAPK